MPEQTTSTAVPQVQLRPIATLRRTGVGRFFVAAFLSLWLVGWVAGELFALSALGGLLAAAFNIAPETSAFGDGPFVSLFLCVWLTLWTFGGYAATSALLDQLVGREEVLLGAGTLLVRTGVWPFRRERSVALSTISAAELSADGTVDITLVGERWRAVTMGSPEQRRSVVEAITAAGLGSVPLSVARTREAPATFALREDGHVTRLVREARAWPLAAVMIPFAVLCFLDVLRAVRVDDDGTTSGVLGVVAVLLGVVGLRKRELGYIARPGVLLQRSGLLQTRERELSPALVVRCHVDSDGDAFFELRSDGRVLLRTMGDAAPCLHLGHFLAARVGHPLKDESAAP